MYIKYIDDTKFVVNIVSGYNNLITEDGYTIVEMSSCLCCEYDVFNKYDVPKYKYDTVNEELSEIIDYKEYVVVDSYWYTFTNKLRDFLTFDPLYWDTYVSTYTDLLALENIEDNTIYYVTEENEIYVYNLSEDIWKIPFQVRGDKNHGVSIKYLTTTILTVTCGFVDIKNKSYGNDYPLTLTWSDIEDGTSKQADTWYYVYIYPDTNKLNYLAYISETAPTKNSNGVTMGSSHIRAKYHPTKSHRFVGSFKTDGSQNIIEFIKTSTNIVLYKSGYNYVLQNGTATSNTAVDCSSYIPCTSSLGKIYYTSIIDGPKYIGLSVTHLITFKEGSGIVDIPIIDGDIYYHTDFQLLGNSISIGVHGYYEDI